MQTVHTKVFHKEYGAGEIVKTNYDVKRAEEDLLKVTDELSRAQTALDQVNNQVEFEIED